MPEQFQPTLLIHGGAGSRITDAKSYALYQASLQEILNAAYPRLKKGGSALQAVIQAVELLEDDPLYNAGKGSKIQSDGRIRMSAAICDGSRRRFAGCVNVERVKNPVRLAEALLKKDDRVLAGRGAERFARETGLNFASPFTAKRRLEHSAQLSGKTGTVGAVALDNKGRLAAATSTGGRGYEFPHRVSDTPTVAGNFANTACAVSATGVGEEIVEFAAASTVCAQVEAGAPLESAITRLFNSARAAKANFGLIAVDSKGRISAETTTACLIWAGASIDGYKFFQEQR